MTRAARVVRDKPVKRVRPVTQLKSADSAALARSEFGTGVLAAADAD